MQASHIHSRYHKRRAAPRTVRALTILIWFAALVSDLVPLLLVDERRLDRRLELVPCGRCVGHAMGLIIRPLCGSYGFFMIDVHVAFSVVVPLWGCAGAPACTACQRGPVIP